MYSYKDLKTIFRMVNFNSIFSKDIENIWKIIYGDNALQVNYCYKRGYEVLYNDL